MKGKEKIAMKVVKLEVNSALKSGQFVFDDVMFDFGGTVFSYEGIVS